MAKSKSKVEIRGGKIVVNADGDEIAKAVAECAAEQKETALASVKAAAAMGDPIAQAMLAYFDEE